MKIPKQIIIFICLVSVSWGCHSDFLDAKPQKSLLVPSTINDMEALLNNSGNVMNVAGYLTLIADGDFRIDDNNLPFLENVLRLNYNWSDETTNWVGDWDYAYKQVFFANIVLQGIDNMEENNIEQKVKELQGRALFHRAWALHLVAQQFADIYQNETAASTLGIPYPLSPNVNQPIQRLSLQKTYEHIFNDLKEALKLLPDKALFITQPSKASTYSLLARLYLIIGEYENAMIAAENALAISSELLDYNQLSPVSDRTFPVPSVDPNPEILYFAIGNTGFTGSTSTFIDSSLYSLYTLGDQRKNLYFTTSLNYKGSYTGATTPFVGLATDEVYLIKAECEARLGKIDNALTTVNYFLSNRYSLIGHPKITGNDPETLLKFILLERRRELVGRGTTWMDLRRLNKQLGFERSLLRVIEGEKYTLEPNSKRYTMKIPMDEIASSGIEQNP